MFNVFTAVGHAFSSFGKLVWAGLKSAKVKGLTDEVLKQALLYVKVAATKFTDNTEKREWVVGILVSKGIPESIARLAIELAYQGLRSEIEKIPG